jgi:hypothetical protein
MSNISPLFSGPGGARQVTFDRAELMHIMNLYGRMVVEGHWRDYAIDMDRHAAVFSAFRNACERPQFRLVKRPDLRSRQGQYMLLNEHGITIRRGHTLGPVLAPIERRLLRLVQA